MPVDMKRLIADAFKKMIQQGNVDKITVKALIDECHVSRQTFYYHFQDIMDVAEWTMRQETQRLIEQSRKMENQHSSLLIFVSFTIEHFPVFRKLLDSQRRPQFEKFMVESIKAYLGELSQYRQENLSLSYADRETLLQYTACGLVGVLLAYGGTLHLDRERLASQLERILLGEVSRWKEP